MLNNALPIWGWWYKCFYSFRFFFFLLFDCVYIFFIVQFLFRYFSYWTLNNGKSSVYFSYRWMPKMFGFLMINNIVASFTASFFFFFLLQFLYLIIIITIIILLHFCCCCWFSIKWWSLFSFRFSCRVNCFVGFFFIV